MYMCVCEFGWLFGGRFVVSVCLGCCLVRCFRCLFWRGVIGFCFAYLMLYSFVLTYACVRCVVLCCTVVRCAVCVVVCCVVLV